ncbi:hybrid sensor histidine kinase/response regulator [Phenylobacterium montanum]|uniref:histidine kinase n=1 Tax=Phenylobacterium montanum TaxID=2823693 RepID=A0A975G062_9CAUL|nr:ATP-binding protein [Caulobacter sp. S6]QUD88670.1 response regulator [Caulobacter sp. S6]
MGMRGAPRLAAIACALACLTAGAPTARAQGSEAPVKLARQIEQRADKSSFADLQRFGEAAGRGTDRESLNRLQHVGWIMLNQSEFESFEHWNGLLLRNAQQQHDDRYIAIARIDELKSRYDRGDASVKDQIARIDKDQADWFVRVHAMSVQAMELIDQDQSSLALKRLSEAEQLIPSGDPASNDAESTIWETIGLALMILDDLDGAAQAFTRADIEFAHPGYPRPDFDDVYNMAHMAVMLGDAKLARELSSVHHQMAVRSDLPHLKIWDQNLCAMVGDSFGTPAEVLRCLRGLDEKLSGAEFLAPDILPLRAIARARTNDIAGAENDLAAIRVLKASNDIETSGLEREGQVAAELLLAQGKTKDAYEALRAYDRQHAVVAARRFNAGVHQLTGALQTQLSTARKDAELQRQAARSQHWIVAFAGLFLVCAAGVVFWQRRIGLRLRAAQLKAELASRSKSEFLANMSHEIRTPLNGVVGVADMLAAAGLPKREREMVEIIRSSGQSLERLLSDVLDLARVEAGRMTIEPAPFQAADLVRTVASLSQVKAQEKGLDLLVQIAPQLEGWFVGDATRVRQILTNLVSNAVKFTDAGSVTITAEPAGEDGLRFVVIDTGVGFDDAEKERLFGRFQQADGSITRRFGGSGLGLAISRQLAALMGGELDCASVPGRGSRFSFEAPFPAASAPETVAERAEEIEAAAERAVRVLVVDDHETNRKVVRMMLDQFGVETVSVVNGLEAVEAARREPFDAIFMDMQMPVMDGLEATRIIRIEEQTGGRGRTPLYMLSANAMPEHREAGLKAGADGHISKPVTAAALLAALSEAVSGGDPVEAEAEPEPIASMVGA